MSKRGQSPKHRALLDELKRKQGYREAKPRYLVCFEDSESSPRYFDALRKHLRLSRESVIIDRGNYTSDPKGVVTRLKDLAAEMRENGNLDLTDATWAVVDVDSHPNLGEAREMSRDNGLSLAVSNPCFEYWILLHFEDSALSANSCKHLISTQLKKHLPNYDKGDTPFDDLVEHVNDAVQRAMSQHRAKGNCDPAEACPCTTVYKLVAKLTGASDGVQAIQ